MALYTILLGISLLMIIFVMALIRKMYCNWKRDHKIERMESRNPVERPAVCVMIYTDKCIMCRQKYSGYIYTYNVIDKSDISIKSLNRAEK